MTWTFQQDSEWFDGDFESMEAAHKWLADSLDEQWDEETSGSYVSYWNPGPERRAQNSPSPRFPRTITETSPSRTDRRVGYDEAVV